MTASTIAKREMETRLPTTFALVGVITLMLAGCSPAPIDPGFTEGPLTPIATAQVSVRTITDAIAFDAVVETSSTYSITAKSDGILSSVRGVFFFQPTAGASEKLVLPATAMSVTALVPLGVPVRSGIPLASVQDSDFFLNALVSPAQVLRLNGREPARVMAQIDGGTGPFECQLADWRPTNSSEKYSLSCRVPEGIPAVAGASGLVVLNLDERVDVLALPIEAVAGSIDAGRVLLRDHTGVAVLTEVSLGITDGAWIEITAGLAKGDTVEMPSPSLISN